MKPKLLFFLILFLLNDQLGMSQFLSNSFKARVDIGGMPLRPGSIAVDDFTGDGFLEFIVGGEWNRKVSVYHNQSTVGNLSFSAGLSFTVNFSDSTKTNGIFSNSLKVADINDDGLKDIVISGYWNGGQINEAGPDQPGLINIYLNKGTETEPSSSDIADKSILANDYNDLNDGNVYIDVADINGDGRPDLAVTQSSGNDLAGNLRLYKNTSAANNVSFTGFAGYPVLKDPGALRIADFDGDGKLDIIVHHFKENQDSVSIFLNNLAIPGIASITPSSAVSGERVIIMGSGFTGATKVIFSGITDNMVLAQNFTVAGNGKTITLNVPAGAGTGKIKIENPTGTYYQDPVFTLTKPAPVIDGIAESFWNDIQAEPITHMINYPVEFDSVDLSGSFKAWWDKEALYVLGRIKDDVLMPPSPSMAGEWNNDYFEVYIDLDNSKNILPEGTPYDQTAYDNNDSQIRFVYATDSVSDGNGWIKSHQSAKDQVVIREVNDLDNRGYTIEMKIPWTAMGETPILPAAGMMIGFDIVLADNDGAGRDRQMGWKTFSDQIYQDPSMFGTFELMNDGSLKSRNDNEKPSPITGLSAEASGKSIVLRWNASTDNVGVTAYKVFNETGARILTTTDTTATFSNLKFNTTYSYLVIAYDKAYNPSAGAGIEFTLVDTEAPSTPANFTAAVTGRNVKLTWNAATDNDKVLNYKIFQDGTLIKTTASLSLAINSLPDNATYVFTLAAVDPSGNLSIPASTTVNISTSVEVTSVVPFAVYPNPVTDKLFITHSSSISSVKITNIAGQIILLKEKIYGNHTEISTASIPKGLYILRVTSFDGTEIIRKIIKE